jgi:hypothetical protein
MTRKSTQKFEVVVKGTVALSGVSKTDATAVARRFPKKDLATVRPVAVSA